MRTALLINGVSDKGLTLEQQVDAAEMLVRTGRAVAPQDWIDRFVEAKALRRYEIEVARLPHQSI